ncbi:MAG TPA: immunoglobulin domain-containing protein [Verrucomicrobiae bacterium]|jgi:hypothetical protein
MKNPQIGTLHPRLEIVRYWSQKISKVFVLCCLTLAGSQTGRSAYLTTANLDSATPSTWAGNVDWQTNTAAGRPGTGATVTGPKIALTAANANGNDCEIISNGFPINTGVATDVALIRTPTAASTFPGLSLTLDTNTILFYKAGNNQVDTYTNLILKGGVICQANGGTVTAVIAGAVTVASQSYLSAGTGNNRVVGVPTVAEVFNISAALSGSGNLFIMDFITNAPNIISGGAKNLSYSGTFIIQYGSLLGTNAGSLGTNSSVIVDPASTLYKADMPLATTDIAPAGKAVFQVAYAYNTAGTLIITNGGLMNLNQHCAFSAVTINGVALSPGDHPYSELIANFPNNFFVGGSDAIASLTVQPYNPVWVYGPPAIIKQPESLSLYSGGMVHFSVLANAAASYQWLSNGVPLDGATNATLAYGSGSADVVAGVNYSVVIANLVGPVTSSVVNVTLRTPTEPYETAVANLGPSAFYQFNETANPATTAGGATAFDNANSLNGSYGAAAQNGSTGIAGPTPSAGVPGFDGSNAAFLPLYNSLGSVVTLPSLNLNTNTMTIVTWINPNATQLASSGIVVCRGSSTIAGLNYGSVFSSDYPLAYTWNNDPNTYGWNSGLFAPINEWSLVALTVTPTNATIYLMNSSGITSARHIYPHPIQAFTDPTIVGGDSLGANRGFSGTIDDVAFFNKALTRDELAAMFYAATGITNYPPIIGVQPVGQTAYVGQTATFTIAGGGSAPFTYQWQADGGSGIFTNIINGGQFAGANSSTLSINNLITGNSGNYQVVLSNPWGTNTSVTANLTVNPPLGSALNITLAVQQVNGANWDSATNWIDGQGGLPASTSAAALPGSTYELLPGSRLRSPATNSFATFPGVQLTMDGTGVWSNNPVAGAPVSELRLKAQTLPVYLNWTVNFTKLIMNGGQIDNAPDGTYSGYVTLGGEVDIISNTPVYNDGAGGDNAGLYLPAWLTGSGTVEFHGDLAGTIPFIALTNNLNVANPTNTFNGAWHIVSGILLGSAPGSLGTNLIVIGSATSTNAALETAYDLNDASANLFLYGQMFLHQNDTFKSLFINGVPLAAGTYSFATLNSTYPANFPATWALQNGSTINSGSGQITILVSPAPIILTQPQPVSLYPGQGAATFNVTAAGNPPLVYSWYTNGTSALSDTANRIGSTSNVLTIPTPTYADAGNYTVVVGNSFGSVTSSIAALTILTPGPAMNFTLDFGGTPINQGIGNDWNTANSWNPGGQPASTELFMNPGSTNEVVVGSRLRTPAATAYNVFPNAQLTVDGSGVFENGTLNAVGELRFKNNNSPSTNYFNNLVLNGGQLDLGDNTYEVIQGQLSVANNSTIYIDSTSGVDRTYQIDSWLTGSANLLWHQYSNTLSGFDLQITGTTNTFNGQWLVDQGVLVGVGVNSLGTNNILVGTTGLPAALETLYDLNSPDGNLVLGATGEVFLHQNDHFASVTINGTPLANGTYSFAVLNSTYPENFPASWPQQAGSTFTTGSGQINVGISSGPASSPHISNLSVNGTSLSIVAANGTANGPWTLLQSTNLALPLSQWQTNSTGNFDASGNLSTVIPNTATNSQEFYLLQVQ